jgi:hypothetical protein
MRYKGYLLNVLMIVEPSLHFLGIIEELEYEVYGSTKEEAISLLKEYIDNLVRYR